MMTSSDWRKPSRKSAFFLVVLATLALLGVPRTVCHQARGLLGVVLRPGQIAGHAVTRAAVRFGRRLVSPPNDPDEIRRLRDQVRQLRVAVHEMQQRSARRETEPGAPPGPAPPPLLKPVLRRAAVIGQDAAALLRQERLLSAGTAGGVRTGALVLGPTTIDQGEPSGLQRGQIVFLGRSVIGRIDQTGPYTSVLQIVTDPGFRKLAQVLRVRGSQYHAGPRGILVGRGAGRCELTRVAAGEDIRVGDWVMTTGYRPLVPHGLAYGRIARCIRHGERQFYWDITVEPSADLENLDRVFVLAAKINPQRLAGTGQEERP